MNSEKLSVNFSDGEKLIRPTAFSTMVKPIGSLCNLDCHYCYYLDKENIYGKKEPKMSDEILEQYIKQYIEANDVPVVSFDWHGGEPLLAGIDYYRKAIALQNRYKGDKRIENTLQTNGTLVNKEWCDFWRENNFLIGISIDGPRDIHDTFRLDKGGKPTFDKVIASIQMMAKYGVEYNTLSTINSLSENRGAEIYRFMKSIGSRYMQFLPVVEHVTQPEGSRRPYIVSPNTKGSSLAEWSVSADGFGKFMNDVFDVWVMYDVGIYYVQLFDVSLAQWVGANPGLCSFTETCGDALVIEHNGDVYSCDHFVYPEYKVGNIMEGKLSDMIKSTQQFAFGINKRNTLPQQCIRCKFYFACRGECPKHRFEISEKGEKGVNSLCAGYKSFFGHIEPYMDYMAKMLTEQKPPALVMEWAKERKSRN